MPDDDPCPVVAEFIRHTRQHFHDSPLRSLYVGVNYELDELLYLSKSQPKDKSTQRVRAFYCLHELFVLLFKSHAEYHSDAKLDMPLDREGINRLIEFCSQERVSAEVKIYALELAGKGQFDDMDRKSAQALIDLSDTIVSAAEYMRPRLRNGQTMTGMGRHLAMGLTRLNVPADQYVVHCTKLINVTSDNKGEHSAWV